MRVKIAGLPLELEGPVRKELEKSPQFRDLAKGRPGEPITVTYGEAVRGDPTLRPVNA